MNIIKQCKYGKMILNRRDCYVGDSLDIYGEYCESEVNIFRQHLKKGDYVIDVGANIGAHTVALAKIIGTSGIVYAFEPERMNYYTLCGNIAINNLHNIQAFQVGISNEEKEIKIPYVDIRNTNNYGSLSLKTDYGNFIGYSIPCVKLDSLSIEKCALIKIDVEGMEKEVILGSLNIIKQFKPILYVEDDREENSTQLRDLITSLDYKIIEHDAQYFNPNNYNKEKYNIFPGLMSYNILCIPN